MKTLILYATKHGATREIAKRIADKIGNAQIHNLKTSGTPDLTKFDCVIVGSPVYIGTIRKEAKAFLAQNVSALCAKKLGLFITGMEMENGHTNFEPNFPSEVLRAAKAKVFFGGIFDPQKAGAIERMMVKFVKKNINYINNIDDDEISRFVEALM